jgi:hypothetical protein
MLAARHSVDPRAVWPPAGALANMGLSIQARRRSKLPKNHTTRSCSPVPDSLFRRVGYQLVPNGPVPTACWTTIKLLACKNDRLGKTSRQSMCPRLVPRKLATLVIMSVSFFLRLVTRKARQGKAMQGKAPNPRLDPRFTICFGHACSVLSCLLAPRAFGSFRETGVQSLLTAKRPGWKLISERKRHGLSESAGQKERANAGQYRAVPFL